MKVLQTITNHLMVSIVIHQITNKFYLGMYANDDDLYGDELEGDEERNDGLNALVISLYLTFRTYNGSLD